MKKILLLATFAAASLLFACEKKSEPTGQSPATETTPPATADTRRLALEPHLVELSTDALPFWRAYRDDKPALVLLSFDPFLQPVAPELRDRAKELVLGGSPDEISRQGSFVRPDPLIMPTQALSAALDAQLFSRIYWVFPAKFAPTQLDLETFSEQMAKAQFFTEDEARRLTLEEGVFRGTLRGIPFEARHYEAFPEVEKPLVLHIDLSFFRGIYENEVKTPLYDLIHQTASRVFDSGWQPLELTLSYSTVQGAISLETRFVLTNLAEILRRPQLLDQDMPQPWQLRAEALYAADMFTESKKLELYRQAAELAPEDPTAVYDLFQAHFLARELDPALAALDRAVALDPGYGAAYLSLAEMALKDGNVEMALTLLEKGAAVFPANPFPSMQRADLLVQTGRGESALTLLEPLFAVDWSPVYHPEVPNMLASLKEAALNPEPAMDEAPDEAKN